MDFIKGREALKVIASRGGDWYTIRNAADDTAEVLIYSEIGGFEVTAEQFLREISEIKASKMVVRINSPGGDVFESVAIYNAIRSHPAHVTTQVDAMAASGASVIAQAGDHRVMLSHSQMMIHEAHGVGIGGSADFREFADFLDKQSDHIASIYAEAAGDMRRKPTFRKMMADETWLNDDEAVEAGLADEVVKPSHATKNQVDLGHMADIVEGESEAVEDKTPKERVSFSGVTNLNLEDIL